MNDAHPAELHEALAAFDIPASSIEVITPPAKAKGGRALYRAQVSDGTPVKLRVLESEVAAERLSAIRAGLSAAFAPVVGVHGAVLLEPWVDGVLLPELGPSPKRCAEAGAVLASLHGSTAGARLPSDPWIESARTDLDALHDAGCLDQRARRALADAIADGDPGAFTGCVIHRDFCGVNMVVDGSGALRVIDNEWFVVGPAGFDLGRTLNRWWMTDTERAAFVTAYEETDGPPEDADLWALVADLFGARVETVMNPEPGTPILDQLLARIGTSRA